MLARNFKTATTLQLTDDQYAALISVLGMLERGELALADIDKPSGPHGFSMSRVWHENECGSVGCIKGWCQQITGQKWLFNLGCGPTAPGICDLFMYGDYRRHKVTPEQAAAGIRNYLATGRADWDGVLAQ